MKTYIFITLYIIAAFLNFGVIYNSYRLPDGTCGIRPNILEQGLKYDKYTDCRMAGFPSGIAGAFWPVYWVGKYAIWITR